LSSSAASENVFWILVLSYWIHLLATVIWLGGQALIALVAWPALRQGTLADNQWWPLQKRFLPWANTSLVILLLTGFIQMTNDENYRGFLAMEGLWAWAILLKHIAFLGMVAITIYLQAILYPAISRHQLLVQSPAEAGAAALHQQEIRLLRLNLLCATAVLFCTAVATAL
jgi:uncharacterized membrane protein